LEPGVVRDASHITAVSPAYPIMLRERYSDVPEDRFTVFPYGAAERDVEMVRTCGIEQSIFRKDQGGIHWSYLGRGGPDMAKSTGALFGAIAGLRDSSEASAWQR